MDNRITPAQRALTQLRLFVEHEGHFTDCIQTIKSELDRLTKALAEAEKDAERYRWLREHSCQADSNGNDAEAWSTHENPKSLDEMVDLEIAKESNELSQQKAS